MPVPDNLLYFLGVSVVLTMAPGPDVIFLASQGLAGGPRAGLAVALGLSSGLLVHTTLAALGVSAVFAASPAAFSLVKWAGAAYLLWLARGAFGEKPAAAGPAALAGGAGALYRRGVVMNLLNPKVALFFLAFVPQFIPPDAPHKAWTFLVLGLIFNLNSLPINLGYAWLAAWAARRLDAVQKAMHWLDRAAGLMFLGFGLRLATTDHPAP